MHRALLLHGAGEEFRAGLARRRANDLNQCACRAASVSITSRRLPCQPARRLEANDVVSPRRLSLQSQYSCRAAARLYRDRSGCLRRRRRAFCWRDNAAFSARIEVIEVGVTTPRRALGGGIKFSSRLMVKKVIFARRGICGEYSICADIGGDGVQPLLLAVVKSARSYLKLFTARCLSKQPSARTAASRHYLKHPLLLGVETENHRAFQASSTACRWYILLKMR